MCMKFILMPAFLGNMLKGLKAVWITLSIEIHQKLYLECKVCMAISRIHFNEIVWKRLTMLSTICGYNWRVLEMQKLPKECPTKQAFSNPCLFKIASVLEAMESTFLARLNILNATWGTSRKMNGWPGFAQIICQRNPRYGICKV